MGPTIKELRERFLLIAQAELDKTRPRLELSEKDEKTLEAMVNAMVKKLLHRPITELKASSEGPETAALIAATRKLFDLEGRQSLPPVAKKQEEPEEVVIAELATATSGGRGENR